jgi:hypothetical protein
MIIFSAHPTQLRSLAQVIIHEFAMLTGPIEKDEFERAKKQLQSMLLMNLESRPVVFEDIARQVLAQGTIHILRKHFYSTKLNLTSKFFTKTDFFSSNQKKFFFNVTF